MECPVCLETKSCEFLQCAHAVCGACWDRIRDRRCPMCRAVEPGAVVDLVSESDSESDSESASDFDIGYFEVIVEVFQIN